MQFDVGNREVKQLIIERNNVVLAEVVDPDYDVNDDTISKAWAFAGGGTLHLIEGFKMCFGLSEGFEYPELRLGDIADMSVDILVSPHSRSGPHLLKHYGVDKYWPLTRWKHLFKLFPARTFTVLGDPYDRPFCNYPNVNYALDRSLPEVASMIRRANLVISIDNGISHLTHFLGGNHLLLYPDGFHQRWLGNLRSNCVTIRDELSRLGVDRVASVIGERWS